jgi:hypothetical protein
MRLIMKTIISLFFVFSLLSFAPAFCAEIVPTSYVFDITPPVWGFPDDTGFQLIDGLYGDDHIIGSPANYPWVGWHYDNEGTRLVTIDFTFAEKSSFNRIEVGAYKQYNSIVPLPSVDIFVSSDGSLWGSPIASYAPSSDLPNEMRYTLTLDKLDISTQYARVSLSHEMTGYWIISDEIDFFGEISGLSIPLPSALMLFGSGLFLLIGFKKFSKIN